MEPDSLGCIVLSSVHRTYGNRGIGGGQDDLRADRTAAGFCDLCPDGIGEKDAEGRQQNMQGGKRNIIGYQREAAAKCIPACYLSAPFPVVQRGRPLEMHFAAASLFGA